MATLGLTGERLAAIGRKVSMVARSLNKDECERLVRIQAAAPPPPPPDVGSDRVTARQAGKYIASRRVAEVSRLLAGDVAPAGHKFCMVCSTFNIYLLRRLKLSSFSDQVNAKKHEEK